MPILFDPADTRTRGFLERRKGAGSMTIEELRQIIPAGEPSAEDMEATIWTLAAMGIRVVGTDVADDQALLQSVRSWTEDGNPAPSLTGSGWASLIRAMDREDKQDD